MLMVNRSYFWILVSFLALSIPLLNAWFGYFFFFSGNLDSYYSAIGGTLPYSDASGYIFGAYHLEDIGKLDGWNMRRPMNALFFLARLKLTQFNFWHTMLLQFLTCAIAMGLFLKTYSRRVESKSSLLSLFFIAIFSFLYIYTTLSDALGLTFGFLSFVLLWEGFLERKRLYFYSGIIFLTIALSTRAGPTFMILSCLFLIWIKPFSNSLLKDLSIGLCCFFVAFLSTMILPLIYGDSSEGQPLSNFACVLYGLVNGGKTWSYAYNNPEIMALLSNKSEADQAKILYTESLKIFCQNPFLLIMGLVLNFLSFCRFFVGVFSIGSGYIKIISQIIIGSGYVLIGINILKRKKIFSQEFIFLVSFFLGITLSAFIVFRDGGMRVFMVAIPFIAGFFGLALAQRKTSLPTALSAKPASLLMSIICLSAIVSPCIPSALTPPMIQNQHIQTQFLSVNLNKNPYLIINFDGKKGLFQIPSERLKQLTAYHDSQGAEIELIMNNHKEEKPIALFYIYDFISHSLKLLMGDPSLLNSPSKWMEFETELYPNTSIYKILSYKGHN